MWFRGSLLTLTVLSWSFTVWMATHVSTSPVVLGRWSNGYAAMLVCFAALSAVISGLLLPAPYRWLHTHRHKIFALGASLLVSAIAVELLVRFVDLFGISYYEEGRRYHLDKAADPDLYYRHRPGFESVYQGVPSSFNELGFRDDPIAPKAENEFRILFVGDSVVAGLAVEQDATFSALVAPELAEKIGRPVRTINGGCGSYNTVQEAALVKKYIGSLEPDLVLLVYVNNDGDPNEKGTFDPWSKVGLSGKSPPQVLRLLAWNSWTYRLVTHAARYSGTPDGGAALATGPGWDESFSALGEIAETCRAAEVRLGVMLWRVSPDPLTDTLWTRLQEVCGEHETPLGDFAPAFEGLDPKQHRVSVVDAHANAVGHEVAARHIVSFIERHGLARR